MRERYYTDMHFLMKPESASALRRHDIYLKNTCFSVKTVADQCIQHSAQSKPLIFGIKGSLVNLVTIFIQKQNMRFMKSINTV